jgi:hypothetical protein
LQVRKDKVLAALQYLVQHNHLYPVLDLDRTGLDLTHESNPTRKSKLELLELLERQLPNTES